MRSGATHDPPVSATCAEPCRMPCGGPPTVSSTTRATGRAEPGPRPGTPHRLSPGSRSSGPPWPRCTGGTPCRGTGSCSASEFGPRRTTGACTATACRYPGTAPKVRTRRRASRRHPGRRPWPGVGAAGEPGRDPARGTVEADVPEPRGDPLTARLMNAQPRFVTAGVRDERHAPSRAHHPFRVCHVGPCASRILPRSKVVAGSDNDLGRGRAAGGYR